jgi:hypothetical protein
MHTHTWLRADKISENLFYLHLALEELEKFHNKREVVRKWLTRRKVERKRNQKKRRNNNSIRPSIQIIFYSSLFFEGLLAEFSIDWKVISRGKIRESLLLWMYCMTSHLKPLQQFLL